MIPALDWRAVQATFPAPALRRTYVQAQLDRYAAGLVFVPLLRKLAPAVYQALRERTVETCFRALYRWCAERFPLYDLESLVGVDLDEDANFESWYQQYIPLQVFGINYYEDGVNSPALGLCIAMSATEEGDGYADVHLNDLECLHDYLDVLPPNIEHQAVMPYRIARQRVWKEPWGALWDLYAYALSNTGYGYLDENDLEMTETNNYPVWNEGEIRALIRHWHHAKPLWERISNLLEYIDCQPERHLPTLAKLLLRDPAALDQVTRPRAPAEKENNWGTGRPASKRLRARVLAEVWK